MSVSLSVQVTVALSAEQEVTVVIPLSDDREATVYGTDGRVCGTFSNGLLLDSARQRIGTLRGDSVHNIQDAHFATIQAGQILSSDGWRLGSYRAGRFENRHNFQIGSYDGDDDVAAAVAALALKDWDTDYSPPPDDDDSD